MKKSGEGRAITPFRWAPALVGLSSAAALVVAVQARTPVVDVAPEIPAPAPRAELMGPPKPEPPKIYGPPLPPELIAKRSGAPVPGVPGQPTPTPGLAGRIGPIGPIAGPLNAQVPEGAPLYGPTWDRKPLPLLPNSAQFVVPAGSTVTPAKPGTVAAASAPSGTGDADSEIPDPTKLALSRAANPTVEVRDRTVVKAEASPEKPVALNVSLGEGGTRTAGDVVVVRLSANVDCYFVVMRVDPAGKAATVFQSSRPAQRVACVVKAGPEAGAEYLVAVASVKALNSEDVTAALKGTGAGFATMPTGAEGGSQPGQAWSTVLAHAGSVGGTPPAARWQRYEWDVATTTFATVAKPEKPAAESTVKSAAVETKTAGSRSATGKSLAAKSPGVKVPASRPAVRKPAETGEVSSLPGGKPEGSAPSEMPAEPQKRDDPSSTGPITPGGE